MPGGPLRIGRADERRPGRVGGRVRIAILSGSGDRVPRPPEVEVVLVVPTVDRRVRPTHVQQCEESRAVGGVAIVPRDELPGDVVPTDAWGALPPPGVEGLLVGPGRAGSPAEGLHLIEFSRVLRAIKRGRWHAAELRRALEEEGLHTADPGGRI